MLDTPPPSPLNLMNVFTYLYMFVASACGATVSVLLALLEGRRLSRLELFATYFIGITFAMFGSGLLGLVFKVPVEISMTIGGSALMMGMVGRTVAEWINKRVKKAMES